MSELSVKVKAEVEVVPVAFAEVKAKVPVPLELKFRPTLVSVPNEARVGAAPVAAAVIFIPLASVAPAA